MDAQWAETRQRVLKNTPITLAAIVGAITTVIGILSTAITALKFIICYAIFIFLALFVGAQFLGFLNKFNLVSYLTRLLERSLGCTPYPLSGQ